MGDRHDEETASDRNTKKVDGHQLALGDEHELSEAAATRGQTKSAGVRRIEAVSSSFTTPLKILLFAGIFLVAYSYGLDGQTRYVYAALATSSFSTHSLLATINIVRAIVAAASQPALAKVADVFGRMELVIFSVVFYVIGTAVDASSNGVSQYAGGVVLYQLGYTGLQLLIEVLVADTTLLRDRLLGSIWPATPFIINTWISGNVTQAVDNGPGWRWGVAMWCIILPATAIPIVLALFLAARRAKHLDRLPAYQPASSLPSFLVSLWWRLDILGLLLLSAVLALILIPLTLAGGMTDKWRQGWVIAMLVVGFVLIPVFVVYELKVATHPVVPFPLLRSRTVTGGLFVAVFLNTVWYMQGDYLYTVLIVAFGQTVTAATRISSLYSFASVITSVTLGVVVRYVRYIKPFQIVGILLFTLAMGLLVKYRSGTDTSGMIGAQVVLGIGGGLFAYPTQAMVQAVTPHENVAVITALYLTCYQLGSAFGGAISGAIWTNTLPAKLSLYLTNQTLATETYASPFTVVPLYPLGTPERDGIVRAYNDVQRLLCITGVCLCVPLLLAALAMRNVKMEDVQSLVPSSGDSVTDDSDGESRRKEKL